MELLVTYDVATSGAAGAKRLRQVAQLCEAHGQRVQKSVFECTLNPAQKEQFMYNLQQIIDQQSDSLRIYRIQQPREENVDVIGKTMTYDLHDPLIL